MAVTSLFIDMTGNTAFYSIDLERKLLKARCQGHNLYYSAWAAVKKYHRLGGLNNKNAFATILESESLRSRCLHKACLAVP